MCHMRSVMCVFRLFLVFVLVFCIFFLVLLGLQFLKHLVPRQTRCSVPSTSFDDARGEKEACQPVKCRGHRLFPHSLPVTGLLLKVELWGRSLILERSMARVMRVKKYGLCEPYIAAPSPEAHYPWFCRSRKITSKASCPLPPAASY